MPTIEEELYDLLATYGATADASAPGRLDRLDLVRRQIARRRSARRLVTLGAAALLVLAAAIPAVVRLATGAAHPGGGTGTATRPATPGPATSGPAVSLPEFSTGFRRVAQRSVTLPGPMQFELVYTPQRWTFSVDADCRTNVPVELTVAVAGAPADSPGLVGITCGPDGSNSRGLPEFRVARPEDRRQGWERWFGVQLGQPVTFVVTLRPWAAAELVGVAHGSAAIGVYEEVSFDDYPLPPRPDRLADLDGLTANPPGWPASPKPEEFIAVLDARTLPHPSGTFELQLPMPASLRCAVDSVAPGDLRFLIAGRPTLGVTFWDWRGRTSSYGPGFDDRAAYGIAIGHPVTITVTATHFDDPAWRVRCYDLGP